MSETRWVIVLDQNLAVGRLPSAEEVKRGLYTVLRSRIDGVIATGHNSSRYRVTSGTLALGRARKLLRSRRLIIARCRVVQILEERDGAIYVHDLDLKSIDRTGRDFSTPSGDLPKTHLDVDIGVHVRFGSRSGQRELGRERQRREGISTIQLCLVVLLMLVVLGGFWMRDPTAFQVFVMRVAVSLLAAMVEDLVAGRILVQLGRTVRATGGLAVFALVYLINPPAFIYQLP